MQLIESKVGGSLESTGTWGHPKVAIRFAQWCSDSFAVQVDCWIDELMTTGSVSLSSPAPAGASLLEQDLKAIEWIAKNLESLGVGRALAESVRINSLTQLHPRYLEPVQSAKQILSDRMEVAEPFLSPTDLGKLFAERTGKAPISARAVNKILEQKGLQEHRPEENPPWVATEAGSHLSKLLLDTAKGHNKTIYSLRWAPSAVEVLLGE